MSDTEQFSRDSIIRLFALLMKGFASGLSPDGAHGAHPEGEGIQGGRQEPDPLFVIRNFWAVAAWLHDDACTGTLRVDDAEIPLDQLFVKALKSGTDPGNQGYWDYHADSRFAAESGTVAWACYLAKGVLFRLLTADQILNVEHWLDSASKFHLSIPNDSILSYALNHSARRDLDWRHDPGIFEKILDKLESFYTEEGWFAARPAKSCVFDDRNNTEFLSGLCCLMLLEKDGDSRLFHTWTSRLNRFLRDFPYFFGADGSHPEYGRGSTGKFARLSGAILAHKLGISPLKSGLLKRLVRMHIGYYIKSGVLDRITGLVSQRLAREGSLSAKDSGDVPGNAYALMQTIGALLLLDKDDPVWTSREDKLPVENGDFLRLINAPVWMLHGTQKDGQIQLINGGSDCGNNVKDPSLLPKYGKFVYSSHLGYVTGTGKDGSVFCCDNCLSVSINRETWSHRESVLTARFIGKEAVLTSYILPVFGKNGKKSAAQLKVDTAVIPLRAGGQIRVHRVRRGFGLGKDTSVYVREGAHALGIMPGEDSFTEALNGLARAECGSRFSVLRILHGYKYAALSRGYEGISDGHNRYPRFLLPRVEAMLGSEKAAWFAVYSHCGLDKDSMGNGEDLSLVISGDSVSLRFKGKEYFSFDMSSKD